MEIFATFIDDIYGARYGPSLARPSKDIFLFQIAVGRGSSGPMAEGSLLELSSLQHEQAPEAP